MLRTLGLALAALSLSGCGESAAGTNDAAQQLKPGKWQYYILMVDGKTWLDTGSKTEGLAWSKPIWLSPQDAEAKMIDPDPWFSPALQMSWDCGPKSPMTMEGGKLEGKYTCHYINHPQVKHDIEIKGEFSGDRYWAKIEQKGSGYKPKQAAGERVGDC